MQWFERDDGDDDSDNGGKKTLCVKFFYSHFVPPLLIRPERALSAVGDVQESIIAARRTSNQQT